MSLDPEVDRLLRNAGWFPGRQVPEDVARWRAALEGDGFALHTAAEAVLLEFGGLRVGSIGPGTDMARSDLQLEPSLAAGEYDRFNKWFEEVHGKELFPLGEVHGGHGYLGIASTGETYLLMERIFARWPSFELALRNLLIGKR